MEEDDQALSDAVEEHYVQRIGEAVAAAMDGDEPTVARRSERKRVPPTKLQVQGRPVVKKKRGRKALKKKPVAAPTKRGATAAPRRGRKTKSVKKRQKKRAKQQGAPKGPAKGKKGKTIVTKKKKSTPKQSGKAKKTKAATTAAQLDPEVAEERQKRRRSTLALNRRKQRTRRAVQLRHVVVGIDGPSACMDYVVSESRCKTAARGWRKNIRFSKSGISQVREVIAGAVRIVGEAAVEDARVMAIREGTYRPEHVSVYPENILNALRDPHAHLRLDELPTGGFVSERLPRNKRAVGQPATVLPVDVTAPVGDAAEAEQVTWHPLAPLSHDQQGGGGDDDEDRTVEMKEGETVEGHAESTDEEEDADETNAYKGPTGYPEDERCYQTGTDKPTEEPMDDEEEEEEDTREPLYGPDPPEDGADKPNEEPVDDEEEDEDAWEPMYGPEPPEDDDRPNVEEKATDEEDAEAEKSEAMADEEPLEEAERVNEDPEGDPVGEVPPSDAMEEVAEDEPATADDPPSVEAAAEEDDGEALSPVPSPPNPSAMATESD